jgi:Tol biopolymer transport system component
VSRLVAPLVLSIAVGATAAAGVVPTGKLLVVAEAAHESGGENYPTDVYVVGVDGRHLHNLTHDHASNGWAQWTPDAKRVIFAGHRSYTDRGPWHIDAINADGSGRRRLTSGAKPALSPDGRRIAFVVERAPDRSVYVMDAAGGNRRLLMRLRDERGTVDAEVSAPDWSADGRWILFTHTTWGAGSSSPTRLYVIHPDGSGLTRLEHSESLLGASWAPRGDTVLIIHDTDFTFAHVRRHGGKPALVPARKIKAPAGSYFVGWTPDGRSILLQTSGGVSTVAVNGAAKPRRLRVDAYGAPVWSPNRRWVAFSRSRVLRTDPIEVATPAGRDRHVVTRRICCLLDEIAWAPST